MSTGFPKVYKARDSQAFEALYARSASARSEVLKAEGSQSIRDFTEHMENAISDLELSLAHAREALAIAKD